MLVLMFHIMVFCVVQGEYEAALKIYDEQVSGLKIAHGCVCSGKSTDVVCACSPGSGKSKFMFHIECRKATRN